MKEKLNVAEQLKKKYHKTEEVTNFKDMLYRSCDIYRNRTAFKLLRFFSSPKIQTDLETFIKFATSSV